MSATIIVWGNEGPDGLPRMGTDGWYVGSMALFTTSLTHTEEVTITEHPVERGVNINDHVRPNPQTFSCECHLTNVPLSTVGTIYNKVLPTTGVRAQSLDLSVVYTTSSLPPKAFTPALPTVLQVQQWINPLFGIPIVEAFSATAVSVPFVVDVNKPDPQPATPSASVLQFDQTFNVNQLVLDQLHQLKEAATILRIYTSERVYDNMVVQSFTETRSADTGTGSDLSIQFHQMRIVDSVLTSAPVPVDPRGSGQVNSGGTGPDKDADTSGKKTTLLRQLINLIKGK